MVLQNDRAGHTSPTVERLLRAGAIVHGRTTTPEFSCLSATHSKLWGVTRNPWNPECTPGGSSGGSAAALAAGSTTLATGSDIGGSIRIPASASGVVGFKPPYGRNPEEPPFNLDFYCHVGPLARTVGDCRLMQNVMAGPHCEDIASLRPKLRIPDLPGDIKGWRVAYSFDLDYFEIDSDVRANMNRVLEYLVEQGSTVSEVALGWGQHCHAAAMNYLGHIFGVYIARLLDEHRDQLTNYARQFGEQGSRVGAEAYLQSLETAGEMYRTLGPILEQHQVLICPTLAIPAAKAELDPTVDTVYVNNKQVEPVLGWCLTYPFNTMSRCPVMSMPSGLAANGVPTGVQVVGRTYDDVRVFQMCAALERAELMNNRRPPI